LPPALEFIEKRKVFEKVVIATSDYQQRYRGMRKAPGRDWGHALLLIADL
jgi:hypothetical protein